MSIEEARKLANIVNILIEGDPPAIFRLTREMLQSNYPGFWWNCNADGNQITAQPRS